MFTKKKIKELKKLCKKSTSVNSWYPYPHDSEERSLTIRGPWNRWFKCQVGNDEKREYTADPVDDIYFAAAAMNNFLPLLEEVEALRDQNQRLRDKAFYIESGQYLK